MDKKLEELFKKMEDIILKADLSDKELYLLDNAYFSLAELNCLYFSCITTFMVHLSKKGMLDEKTENIFYEFTRHLLDNTFTIAENSLTARLFDEEDNDEEDDSNIKDPIKNC